VGNGRLNERGRKRDVMLLKARVRSKVNAKVVGQEEDGKSARKWKEDKHRMLVRMR